MADLNPDVLNAFKPLMAAWMEAFGKLSEPVQASWNKDFAAMADKEANKDLID